MSEPNQVFGPTTDLRIFAESREDTLEAASNLQFFLDAAQDDANRTSLQNSLPEDDATIHGSAIKTKKIERRAETKNSRTKRIKESILVRKEQADQFADHFSQRQGNKEYRLNSRLLSQLAQEIGSGLHANLTIDDIIRLIKSRMEENQTSPDPAIVDKTFDFLLEITQAQAMGSTPEERDQLLKIRAKLVEAKQKHFDTYPDEIQVGHRIIGAVDAVVSTTGLSVKDTLTHYRDVVHNPPDIYALFRYYQPKGYKLMRDELKGLSTFLGANLKKGHLENPELARLATAAKKMQALLGVFKQAQKQYRVMTHYLTSQGVIPSIRYG